MPAYAKNLLPWSVVSHPLEGEAPAIYLALGYSKVLSRLDSGRRAGRDETGVECTGSAGQRRDADEKAPTTPLAAVFFQRGYRRVSGSCAQAGDGCHVTGDRTRTG